MATAKEIMEALLAGKQVWQDTDAWILDGDSGNLLSYDDGSWEPIGGHFMELLWNESVIIADGDAVVDFGRAMGLMASGKTIRCLCSGNQYRIEDGQLMSSINGRPWGREMYGFCENEQDFPWTVVE